MCYYYSVWLLLLYTYINKQNRADHISREVDLFNMLRVIWKWKLPEFQVRYKEMIFQNK